MITHIVAFRLAAETPEQKAHDVRELARVLEALPATIPHVDSLRVGADLGVIDTHWDAVLVSEHASAAELEAYQAHPDHQAALQTINPLVTARAVVDFDTQEMPS